ncbi:hypothetical protein QMT40_002505 [Parvibaculaceae bacterium PLY_AMNH_Bact1]|nr:hypothetical protein QMT40_002505 [Parvibaculaceae bacterium PLY_AMNH_Bact1]
MAEHTDPERQQPPHEAHEDESNTGIADVVPPDDVDRWTLMRDVTVFQGKLILDGLRDLLLSPISIAAALIGIIGGGDRPGRQFYDLLYLGKRSEKWINLFGAASHVSPPAFDKEDSESVDALVDRLETVARRQYEKGGLTQNAKDAVDRALDAVNKGLTSKKP